MGPGSKIAVLLAGSLLFAGCGSSSSSSTNAPAGASSSPSTGGTASSTGSTTSSTPATTGTANTGTSATPPPTGTTGPEGVALETGPPLAPASSTLPGTTVDGIQCAPLEQLAYHIHAHLQVFVSGKPRQLPAAIGLVGPVAQQTAVGPFYGAQKCYYWLHTHTNDGIIHIESPTKRIYTLGDFFDEWHQPLSGNQVASDKGKVTAFLNGKRWTQDVRSIPLAAHNQVQLSVGAPVVPFEKISFGTSGL